MLFGQKSNKEKPILKINKKIEDNIMAKPKEDKLFVVFQDDHHYCQVDEIVNDQEVLKRELREIDLEKDGMVIGIIKGIKADQRKFERHKIDFGSNPPKEHDKIYVAYWDDQNSYRIEEFDVNDVKSVKRLLTNETGVVHEVIRGRKANLIIQDRYKLEWIDD